MRTMTGPAGRRSGARGRLPGRARGLPRPPRRRSADVVEIGGHLGGGMPDRVKCLHALVAHALAAGPGVNPFGDEALDALADWWRAGRASITDNLHNLCEATVRICHDPGKIRESGRRGRRKVRDVIRLSGALVDGPGEARREANES